MARAAVIELSQEEERELRAVLRTPSASQQQALRARIVLSAAQGATNTQIAAEVGVSLPTAGLWRRNFAQRRLEGLADAPRSGRPARADEAYLRTLEEAADASPRELGLGFDVWTSERLGAYLEEWTGVGIAPGWLRTLLARRLFRCGRPKHTLSHLRDPEEVAACEAELAEAEKK